MIYLLILLVPLLYSLRFEFSQTKKIGNKFSTAMWRGYVLCFILFTLLAALRYKIGGDTLGYSHDYTQMKTLGYLDLSQFFGSKYQPGWVLFHSFCRTISGNFVFLQIIHAVIINYVFFVFIKKYSVAPFFSLIIYYFVSYLNFNTEILRESLAVSFSVLAFISLDKKKLPLSFFFAFVSFMFHVSGIMTLLYYILYFISFSKKSLLIGAIICLAAPFLWPLLPEIADYLPYLFPEQTIEMYLSTEFLHAVNNNGYIYMYLYNFVFPLLVIICMSKEGKSKWGMFILAYSLLKILGIFSIGFERFSNYFVVFLWLGLADVCLNILTVFKLKPIKPIIILSVLLSVFHVYTRSLFYEDTTNATTYQYMYQRYFPYKSVLEAGNSYSN